MTDHTSGTLQPSLGLRHTTRVDREPAQGQHRHAAQLVRKLSRDELLQIDVPQHAAHLGLPPGAALFAPHGALEDALVTEGAQRRKPGSGHRTGQTGGRGVQFPSGRGRLQLAIAYEPQPHTLVRGHVGRTELDQQFGTVLSCFDGTAQIQHGLRAVGAG